MRTWGMTGSRIECFYRAEKAHGRETEIDLNMRKIRSYERERQRERELQGAT